MIPTDQIYTRAGRNYLQPAYYKFLLAHDLIVDASEGGLIQGPSLAEGGISLMHWNRDAEIFICDPVGGWQFLVNAFAAHDHYDELVERSVHPLLSDLRFRPYQIPPHINVIEVTPRSVEGQQQTPVLMINTNQAFIIPQAPAQEHLNFLDTINRAAWQTHFVEKQPTGTLRYSAFLATYQSGGAN